MLTKRLVPLLVLAFVLTIAPDALAHYCFRCHPITQACITTTNFGFAFCGWDAGGCYTESFCGDHSLSAPEPLAAKFTVASVERLDEPKTAAPETLVASVEAPAPANN